MKKAYFKDRFAGKVAVVTGGASGIGKCVAERFAAEGGKVAIVDIDEEGMDIVCKEIGADKAMKVNCDITKRADVYAAVEKIAAHFGHIDCLFNIAGVTYRAHFLEMEEEGFEQVMAVNVKGTVNMAQAVAKHMIANDIKGSIVNTSSLNAHVVAPTNPAYCCSKGAVLTLSRAMAIGLIGHGIRVNTLTPGFTDTPFTAPTLADPEKAKVFISNMPIGRVGESEEQASAALYLASDDSSFMIGGEMVVDGGVLVRN